MSNSFRKGLDAAKKGHQIAMHLDDIINDGNIQENSRAFDQAEKALELLKTSEEVLYSGEKEEDQLIAELEDLITHINQEGLDRETVRRCIEIAERAVRNINRETELEIDAAHVLNELHHEVAGTELAEVEKREEEKLEGEINHTDEEIEKLLNELSVLINDISKSGYSADKLVREMKNMKSNLKNMRQKLSKAHSIL